MSVDDKLMHGDVPSPKETFPPAAVLSSANQTRVSPHSSPTLSPVMLSPGSNTNKLVASGKIKNCFVLLQKTEIGEGCLNEFVDTGEAERLSGSTRECTPTIMCAEDEALGDGGDGPGEYDAHDHSYGSDNPGTTRPEFDSSCINANRNIFSSFLLEFPIAKMSSSVAMEEGPWKSSVSVGEDDAVLESGAKSSQLLNATDTGVTAVDTCRFHRKRHLSDDLMSISSTGSSETIEYPISPEADPQERSDLSQDINSGKHITEHEKSDEFQDEPPRLERLESLPESSSCLDNPPVLSPFLLASTNKDNHQRAVQFFGVSSLIESVENGDPSRASTTNEIDEQKHIDPSGETCSKLGNSIQPVVKGQCESSCWVPQHLSNVVKTDQSGQRHQNVRDEEPLSSLKTDTAHKSTKIFTDTVMDYVCFPQLENRLYVETKSQEHTRRLFHESQELVVPTETLPRGAALDPQIVAVMSLHSTSGQESSETRKEPVGVSQNVPKVTIVARDQLGILAPSVEQSSTNTNSRCTVNGHNIPPPIGANEVSASTQSPYSALYGINSDLEMERAIASISDIQPQLENETDENPKYVFESNIELAEVVIDSGADGSDSPASTTGIAYIKDVVMLRSQEAEEMENHCERTKELESLNGQIGANKTQYTGQVQDKQSKPNNHRNSSVKHTAYNNLGESVQQSSVTVDLGQTVKENGGSIEASKARENFNAVPTSLCSDRRNQRETNRNEDETTGIPVPNSVPNEQQRPIFPMQICTTVSSSALMNQNTVYTNSSSPIKASSKNLGDNYCASKSRDSVTEILDLERTTGVFVSESCVNTNPRKVSSDEMALPSISQEMDTAISLALMSEMASSKVHQNQTGKNQTSKTSIQSTATAQVSQLNSRPDDVRVRHLSASDTPSVVPQDANAELNPQRPHSSNSAPVGDYQNGASTSETLDENDQKATEGNRGRTRDGHAGGFAVVNYADPAPSNPRQLDELRWHLLKDRQMQPKPTKEAGPYQQVPPQMSQQVLSMQGGPMKERNRYKSRSRRDIVTFGVGIPIECGGKRLVAYNTEGICPPTNVFVNQTNGNIDIRNPPSKFLTRDSNSVFSNTPHPTHFRLQQNIVINPQHSQANAHANNQQICQPHAGATSTFPSKSYQQLHQITPVQQNAIFLGKQPQKSPSHSRQQEEYPRDISWKNHPNSTPCTYPGNVAAVAQTTQLYKEGNIPRHGVKSSVAYSDYSTHLRGTSCRNASQSESASSGRQGSSAIPIALDCPTESYQIQQQMFVRPRNSVTAPGQFLSHKGGTLELATRSSEYRHTGTHQTTNLRNDTTPAVTIAAVYNHNENDSILESAMGSRTEQITKSPALHLNRHEDRSCSTNIASTYMVELAQTRRGRAAESGLYQGNNSSYISHQNQGTAGRQPVTSQTFQSGERRGHRGLDPIDHNNRQQGSHVPTPTNLHSSAKYQSRERSLVPIQDHWTSLTNNPAFQKLSEGEIALLQSLPRQLAMYLIDQNSKGVSIREGLRTISDSLFPEKDVALNREQEREKQAPDKRDQRRREWHSTIHYISAEASTPRNQASGIPPQNTGYLNLTQNSGHPVYSHHTSTTLTNPEAVSTEKTRPQDSTVCNSDEGRQNPEEQTRDFLNKPKSFHNPPPSVTPLLEADVRMSVEGHPITREGEVDAISSPQHTDAATAIDLSTQTPKGMSRCTNENVMYANRHPHFDNFYHRAYSAGGCGPIRVSSLVNLSSEELSPGTDGLTSPELSPTQLLIRNRLIERRLRIEGRSISTPDILHGYEHPKKRRKVFPDRIPEDNREPMVRTKATSPLVSPSSTVNGSGCCSSPLQGLRDSGHTVIDLTDEDYGEPAVESNVGAQYPKLKSSLQNRWVNQSVQTRRVPSPNQGNGHSTVSISSNTDPVVTDKNATTRTTQEPNMTESASVLAVGQSHLFRVGNTPEASVVKTPTLHVENGQKRGKNHRRTRGSFFNRKQKAEETFDVLFTSCKFCPFEGRLSEVRSHTNLVHFAKYCKKDLSASKQTTLSTLGNAPPKPGVIAREMGVNMSENVTVPVKVNTTKKPNNDPEKSRGDLNIAVDAEIGNLTTPTAIFRQISRSIPVSVRSRGILAVASSPEPFQQEITRAVAPRTDCQMNETRVAEATSPPSQPATGTGTNVTKFSPNVPQHETDEPICKRCGLSCQTLKNLEIHVKFHHTNTKGMHMCFTCGRTCKSNHGLIKHIQKRHVDPERIITEQLYSCVHSECGLSFVNKKELARHMRSHFKRKYICELCDAKYDYIGELRHHQLQHTDNSPHQCKECRLQFRSAGMLHRHKVLTKHSSSSKS